MPYMSKAKIDLDRRGEEQRGESTKSRCEEQQQKKGKTGVIS